MKLYERESDNFTEIIRQIANNPERLETLGLYLSQHFDNFAGRCGSVEGMINNFRQFAEMEL